MIRTFKQSAVAFAIVISAIGGANGQPPPAETTFGYAWYDSTGANSVTSLSLVEGTTTTLRLYVVGTNLTGAAIVNVEGLFGIDGQTTITSGTAFLQFAAGSATTNPAFNDTLNVPANTTTPTVASIYGARVAGATFPEILRPDRVFAGSVTFQGLTPGVATTVTTSPAGSYILTGTNFYVLDPVMSPANLSVDVTPVPEPAVIFSFGAVVAFGVRIARRRRVLA